MRKKKDKPAEVEKYKISPELMKISKAYAQQSKLAGMLKQGIMVKLSEAERMKQALFGAEQQKEMLLNQVEPAEPELHMQPGRDFDLEIRY